MTVYSGRMTTYVGIDFERANKHKGSICAYGLAFDDGSLEKQVIALHETMPAQEATRFHGITAEETANGAPFLELYSRLAALPEDTVLVAHDLKMDRRSFFAACTVWGLPKLKLTWLDSLKVAQRQLGKQNKTGVATMAKRLKMTIKHHDPSHDALVALAVVKHYAGVDPLYLVKD